MVRPGLLVALILLIVPLCVMLFKPAAKAGPNTITVNTTDDPGTSSECSLHGAIENANSKSTNSDNDCVAGTGNDLIVFSGVTAPITLSGSLPAIANTLTIDGGQKITVDGAGSYQVLAVNSGATLNLNDITIANGDNSSGDGGGVFNVGTLNVTDSSFPGQQRVGRRGRHR